MTTRMRAVLLAAALMLVPLAARAADLVIWWEESFYPEEDQATRELVATFEAMTGKTVELTFLPQSETVAKVEAALAAGRPPDLLRGDDVSLRPERWAAAGALADLSDVVLPIKDRFFPGLLDVTFLPDVRTGHLTPFTVPLGQASTYLHVWTSLLQRAGIKPGAIPREWEPFWSFWCDTVQPAVRKALGRDDIWGLGLAMSPLASDASDALAQFMIARSAYFWPGSGRSLDEQPAFRANLIGALADYTAPWRKGCVPPDAVHWTNPDNNKAFLNQRVVMTPNPSLSIVAALRQLAHRLLWGNRDHRLAFGTGWQDIPPSVLLLRSGCLCWCARRAECQGLPPLSVARQAAWPLAGGGARAMAAEHARADRLLVLDGPRRPPSALSCRAARWAEHAAVGTSARCTEPTMGSGCPRAAVWRCGSTHCGRRADARAGG
jgi:ABC-type glycerol-3-phosphate transport system substrate-binding protein